METCTAYCKINYIHQIDYKKLISYYLSLPFDNQIYPVVSIDRIVLSTTSTGTLSSVLLTRAENSSKSSRSIFISKAS